MALSVTFATMDYDNPYRARPTHRRYLCSLLIIGGVIGLLWPLTTVVSFFRLRARSVSAEGVVVGYEFVGGKERLRVKVVQNGNRETYMLLDTPASTPRYAERQQVEVLSWPVTNSLGQRFDQTVVYAAHNYWLLPTAAAALSGLALTVGSIGVIRLRRAQQPRNDAGPF
jgi:hypothetical protein